MPDNLIVVPDTRKLVGQDEARIFWATGIAGALFLLTLVFAGCEFWLVQKALENQIVGSNLVTSQRDRMLRLVNEETGIRGFVATGDGRFLDPYYDAQAQIPDLNAALASGDESMVPDAIFAPTMRAQDRVEAYFSSELSLVRAGKTTLARKRLTEGMRLFDSLRDAEGALAVHLLTNVHALRQRTLFYVHAGIAGALAAIVLLSAWWVSFAFTLRKTNAYRRSALRDALTGALNRRGALAAIESHIGSGHQPFGVVFIDLDGFKKVNDSYGHAAGDIILKAVATRLRSELRSEDNVCRLGGDEFVCVLSRPATIEQVRLIASRLRKSIARPYSFEGEDYIIGCSVGVSMYPDHGDSADVLLSVADRAMYGAKASGGGVREPLTA